MATGKAPFPELGDWRGTRETLHAYCKVLGTIRAAFAPEEPRYAHISLRLYTSGLTTTPIPTPGKPGETFALSLDLRNHYVLLSTSGGEVQQIRMSEGLSATQLGEELIGKLDALGIKGKVNAKKFHNDGRREYALDEAERYFAALTRAGQVFEQFRAGLSGAADPVQLWPHHFDLSFVLLGSKTVKEKDADYPSQITVGFAPADSSTPTEYFYCNPYPFEKSVTEGDLPAGARWHTNGWNGALYPYGEVAGKADGAERLLQFLQAAYAAEKSYI
jgi:hypothetical protein